MCHMILKFSKHCHWLLKRYLFAKCLNVVRYIEQNAFIEKLCKETNLHGFNHIGNRNYTAFERIGWLALVVLFTYFAFFICIGQVSRFINDPFIYTVETNYVDWPFYRPAYTLCSDYINETFIYEYYKRSENTTPIDIDWKVYHDYRHYMKIIGALNAENINSIEQFNNTELFKDLSGEELFDIALNQKYLYGEDEHFGRPVVTEAGICWSNTKLFEYFKAIQNEYEIEVLNHIDQSYVEKY